MPLHNYRTVAETVEAVLARKELTYPNTGEIYAIDGDRVDLRLKNSTSIIRHVEVVGSVGVLAVGQTVPIQWNDTRPVVLAVASVGAGGYGTGIGTVVTDDRTLENSPAGIRVKVGGIGLQHLGFVPSLEGHVHADMWKDSGWVVDEDGTIHSGRTYIYPTGQISLGYGNDVIKLDSYNADWALWIGASDPELAPFRVTPQGDAWFDSVTISADLQSENYSQGLQGWKLDSTGWAEFQDVTVRGKVQSLVFEYSKMSAVGGRMVVTDAAVFVADCASTDTFIDVDPGVFENDDIIQINPDLYRNEWMKITDGGTPITGGMRYLVERDLSSGGAEDFLSGETLVRRGSAGTTFTLGANPTEPWGEPEWGTEPFGGYGFTSQGGWLTLEGSRDYGPYFGVSLRFGPTYNQVADVARLGRLKGFLGIDTDEYGVGIGDTNQHLLYTYADGLELTTADGSTTIDDSGVLTELFGMNLAPEDPGYTDGVVRFWSKYEASDYKIYANVKDGEFEDSAVWFSFAAGGVQASDADTVDSIHALASATANYLCALDGSAKGPFSITGDADTVDDYHAADFARKDETGANISVYWNFQAGLNVGIEDDTAGLISIFGDDTGTGGGELRLFTSGDWDTSFQYWAAEIYQDTLRFLTSAGNIALTMNTGLIHFNSGLEDMDVRMSGDTDAWLFELNANLDLLNFRNVAFQTMFDVADIGTPPANPGAGFLRFYHDGNEVYTKTSGGVVQRLSDDADMVDGRHHYDLTGAGENLIKNGGFAYDRSGVLPSHWNTWDSGAGLFVAGFPQTWHDNTSWTLKDGDNCSSGIYGSTLVISVDHAYNASELFTFFTDLFPVQEREKYSAQIRVGVHRVEPSTSYIRISWCNEAGGNISYSYLLLNGTGTQFFDNAYGGGDQLDEYAHHFVEGAEAPALAVQARLELVGYGYESGSDCYWFLDHAKMEKGTHITPFKTKQDYPRRKYIEWAPVAWDSDLEVGDGQHYWHCPRYMNGWHLAEVHGELIAAGITGNTEFQIRNVTQTMDLLTNKIRVETGETGSDTAVQQPSINASNYLILENDLLALDIDLVATGTAPQGAVITLGFDPP